MCPISCTYSLEFITTEDHPRRGVAFLISEDEKVVAKSAFDLLNEEVERALRTRFDAWVDGLTNKKWYHGWNQSEFRGKYTKCFVFKCKEKRSFHRFYGFLSNPRSSDPSYQVCILVNHAFKSEWETDEADLKDVEEIRMSYLVQKIIDNYFRETP